MSLSETQMEDAEENKNNPQTEEELSQEIERCKAEKKKMQDEFNIQRAKMRDLFLQKEDEYNRKSVENFKLKEEIETMRRELDDTKSQLVVVGLTKETHLEDQKRKAAAEIASLEHLVHETIEESSSTRLRYDEELNKLQSYISQLQVEIQQLKNEKQQLQHSTNQEHTSLGPSVVFNALTKGIKKLGADTFVSQDSVDESSRKSHEDPEVLRSLVEPLEDQIKALKEKLRHTDELLQKCKECGHFQDEPAASHGLAMQSTTSTNTSFDSQKQAEETHVVCDMCSNYEDQLVTEQKRTKELEALMQRSEKAAERHREELLKEIGFRKDMEEKWNEKKEELKQKVAELTRSTECAEQDLKELRQYFSQINTDMKETLATLTREREKIHHELDKLQRENDNLIGKYTIHSQELQSEAINLPDTVEELHELILRNHQDLIIAKIGKEAAEEKINNLQSDIMLLRDQIKHDQNEKESLENNLVQEIEMLRKQSQHLQQEKKAYLSNQDSSQRKVMELQQQLSEALISKKQVEEQTNELRTRISSLQQELDNSEHVQKDFVRLSQSLQVQLERIRDSDSQVRWQFEEDVEECPGCRQRFNGSKRKVHCMHCGQIFCHTCLVRTVNSGPRMRPSKVCDVCHTLLVKSSAPYFSEAPPMT